MFAGLPNQSPLLTMVRYIRKEVSCISQTPWADTTPSWKKQPKVRKNMSYFQNITMIRFIISSFRYSILDYKIYSDIISITSSKLKPFQDPLLLLQLQKHFKIYPLYMILPSLFALAKLVINISFDRWRWQTKSLNIAISIRYLHMTHNPLRCWGATSRRNVWYHDKN